MKYRLAVVIGLGLTAMVAGCKEKTPNRDFIPVIKQRVFLLQEAIKQRTHSAVDSLLTKDYAGNNGADSVIQFAYGDDPSFQFARFDRAEIFYTDDKARVDGFIAGADGRILKNMTLTYQHTGEKWLLKHIGPGPIDTSASTVDSSIQRHSVDSMSESAADTSH